MEGRVVGMEYEYYVRLEYPEFPDPEKPLGVYRAPDGNLLRMEAFHRDHKWHYSEALARKFFEGDTMTVKKVSRASAVKALKHITGVDRDFTETEETIQ
jgi:hypothetical protein